METPVTFVYLGPTMPKYGKAALRLAQEFGGVQVEFLANASSIADLGLKGIDTLRIEDFYDPAPFQSAAKRILFDRNFRDGLWLKSLERFFVLQQFAMQFGRSRIFHAELDQLLFRVDKLLTNIELTGKRGAFFPFHIRENAVASLIYFNELQSLTSIVDFASTEAMSKNEMRMLSQWAFRFPDKMWILPTAVSGTIEEYSSYFSPLKVMKVNEIGGYVDAAQIGQWVAGIDPRNVPISLVPKNRFVDEEHPLLLNKENLLSIKFDLREDKQLKVSVDGGTSTNIFNLHIHSKVHRWFWRNRKRLEVFFITLADGRSFRFPGNRKTQIQEYLKSKLDFIARNPDKLKMKSLEILYLLSQRRPSIYPILSTDSFARRCEIVIRQSRTIKKNAKSFIPHTVFIEANSLDSYLSDPVFGEYQSRILIIGGEDSNLVLETLSKKLGKLNKKILVQNLEFEVEGCQPIPLGVRDKKTGASVKGFALENLSSDRRKIHEIIVFFDYFSKSFDVERVFQQLWERKNFHLGEEMSLSQKRSSLTTFAFRLFPEDSMKDSHDLWETIYLGCIPIVKRTYLSEYFQGRGIPLWTIDSLDEVFAMSQEQLINKRLEILNNFDPESLRVDYWFK